MNDKKSQEEKVSMEKTTEAPKEDVCSVFKNEAEKNLAGWKRAMADYENLYKRVVKEKLAARQEGIEESLSYLLVVLDYFNAAFSSIPDEIAKNQWVKGVENIQKAFFDALSNLGIQPVNEINVPFNPAIHEAVEHENNGNIPAGNVSSIIASGYHRGNKTIRPAKVRISNGKANQRENNISPPTQNSPQETKPPEIEKKEEIENTLINQ